MSRQDNIDYYTPVHPRDLYGSSKSTPTKSKIHHPIFTKIYDRKNLATHFPPPHLHIFILNSVPIPQDIPCQLLGWQIRDAVQVWRTIKAKHSSPQHGQIAFCHDPTVLMWENSIELLECLLLNYRLHYQNQLHIGNLTELEPFPDNEYHIRESDYDNLDFIGNKQIHKSHQAYLEYVQRGFFHIKPPKIYFPPATQFPKSIYPTEVYANEY